MTIGAPTPRTAAPAVNLLRDITGPSERLVPGCSLDNMGNLPFRMVGNLR